MKKPVILVALLLVAAALWLLWQVREINDGSTLVLYGNVDIRQVALAFEGSGRVESLHVEEGDRVKAGEVLARLDTRTLALQAEQARAEMAAREQALLRLQRGSREQEIEAAQAAHAAARAEMAFAEQDFQRIEQLAQQQVISLQERDRAASRWQVMQAHHQQTLKALELARIGPREEDIDQAQAQLNAARAALALLEHHITLGELEAPADAVVRSRLLEVGDMATPQRPVFALALTDAKWVRVYISEPDLGHIHPGMAAHIMTDSAPNQPISGTVGYISSVAEFTPKSVQTEELRTALVYEVRVLVNDPQNRLRLGQPVTVNISKEK